MKRSIIRRVLSVIPLLIGYITIVYPQYSWPTYGDNIIYTNDKRVGIGTYDVNSYVKFQIESTYNEYGGSGKNQHTKMSTNYSSYLIGETNSYLGYSSIWAIQSNMSAIMGNLTLKKDRADGSVNSYSCGGRFALTFDDYLPAGANKHYLSGINSDINGTISSYPSSHAIAAIIGRDNINNGNTYAGYFEGKGYFSNPVCIGTKTIGDYHLAVAGKIRATEVKVEELPWADFVFNDDYKLMTLADIEKHIIENKKLPGIPTSQEVQQNGINLGEMNAKLLQKIEELTLYIINQEKRISSLEEKIKQE